MYGVTIANELEKAILREGAETVAMFLAEAVIGVHRARRAPPIATVRASPDSDCAVEEETRTQSRYSFLSATIGSILVAR